MTNWILLSFLAALATAAGTIFLKLVNNTKFDNEFVLAIVFIIMGLFSLIFLLFKKNILFKNFDNCSKFTLFILILYAIFIIIEYILIINAIKYSPNIGFTRIIINLNIIITLLISYFIFKEKLNLKCIIGIIFCLIGIFIIAYYYDK